MEDRRMTNEEVDRFHVDMAKVEVELERLGRSICSAAGSFSSWGAINRALDDVRDSIRMARMMRPVDISVGRVVTLDEDDHRGRYTIVDIDGDDVVLVRYSMYMEVEDEVHKSRKDLEN